MELDTIATLIGFGVILMGGGGAFYAVKAMAKEALYLAKSNQRTLTGNDGMGGLVSRMSHQESKNSVIERIEGEMKEVKEKQEMVYNLIVKIAIKEGIDVPFK